MALKKSNMGDWITYLAILLTCLLLTTGSVRGSPVDDVEAEGGTEAGGEDGSGEGIVALMEDRMADEGGVVVVENGTLEAVVLDCPYHLQQDTQGFHIKWYHSRITNPVYQWIPNYKPTAMFLLKDRLDLTYEASPEALHRHRALRILNPTTDIAGRYVCHAATFKEDTQYPQELIVFRQPSALDVRVEVREENKVAVICTVEEVYPQPVLYLYQKSSSKDSGEILKGGTPVTSFVGQTYNMEVEKVMEEATLDGPTEFECHVTIPKTEMRRVASIKYQPRVSLTTGAVTAASSTQQASAVLLAVLSLLSCLLHH